MNTIRIIDCTFALIGLVILMPVLLFIAVVIKLTSKGPVLYKQTRVGKNGQDFKLYKFRSMKTGADKSGLLTVGGKDSRITGIGYFLRKYKLDELPQLFNVFAGKMSLVGPRPEVRKYVELYTAEQRKVLNVLPGITDYASIEYRNENELLALAADPEAFYINEIMPRKIELNQAYIKNRSLKTYFGVIIKTVITSINGK
jgi:lipopolysaccharide/colanic/teichoic acid biosynthesis glycosyltransferase